MRHHTAIIALLATSIVAFAACSRNPEETTAHAQQPGSDSTYDSNGTATTDPNANGTAVPADNTGINKRDREGANPTAGDQSQSTEDLDLLKRVRQSIEADDTLSANGKNVKVVTRDGMVTLRGPVQDENERKAIGDKATQIAGASRVQNLLEVAR